MRIDIIIILNVIFVIRRRNKQGIEINYFDPQLLQIVQLFQYPLKITAIKFPHSHQRRIFIPVIHLCTRLSNIHILTGLYIIICISIIKTIHKNLIHYCAFCPVRRCKPWSDGKGVRSDYLVCDTVSVVITDLLSFLYLKAISECILSHSPVHFIKVKFTLCIYFLQIIFRVSGQKANGIYIIFRSAKTQRDCLICIGLRGNDIRPRPVTKQCLLIHISYPLS